MSLFVNRNLPFDTHEICFDVFNFRLSVVYSSKEELRTSACDFWCAILSSENEVTLSLFCCFDEMLSL